MYVYTHSLPPSFLKRMACIYYLLKDGEIVYIGKTIFLAQLIVDGLPDIDFDSLLYKPVHPVGLQATLRDEIRAFLPIHNDASARISSESSSVNSFLKKLKSDIPSDTVALYLETVGAFKFELNGEQMYVEEDLLGAILYLES